MGVPMVGVCARGDLLYEGLEGLGGPPVWLSGVAHVSLLAAIFINVYFCRCIIFVWGNQASERKAKKQS
eukprot:m.96105 g.96105  ORF g.96105 m.96105 type:complete len:69 (-) comp10144_c0_seq1:155-361(-)